MYMCVYLIIRLRTRISIRSYYRFIEKSRANNLIVLLKPKFSSLFLQNYFERRGKHCFLREIRPYGVARRIAAFAIVYYAVVSFH